MKKEMKLFLLSLLILVLAFTFVFSEPLVLPNPPASPTNYGDTGSNANNNYNGGGGSILPDSNVPNSGINNVTNRSDFLLPLLNEDGSINWVFIVVVVLIIIFISLIVVIYLIKKKNKEEFKSEYGFKE